MKRIYIKSFVKEYEKKIHTRISSKHCSVMDSMESLMLWMDDEQKEFRNSAAKSCPRISPLQKDLVGWSNNQDEKKTCVTRGVWGYSGLLHGALYGTQEFYSYLDPTVLLPTSLLQSAFWKTGSAESIALPKITPPSASAVLMQRLVCVGRRISTLLASTQDTSERPAHLQHNN